MSGSKLNETVPDSLAGERIDRVVALLADLARTTVADLIDVGAVRIDGHAPKSRSLKLMGGEQLEVDLPGAIDTVLVPDGGVDVSVVHVDDQVIVVNKPAGLVVHPGAGHEEGTLVHGLLARFPDLARTLPGDSHRPGIVHRLDVGSSGLLVVARTQQAYEALVHSLQSREVERRYLALVWGNLQPDRGMIDAPIGRATNHRTRMAVAAGGREARTHYHVLHRVAEPKVSLVDAKLETGRTHQIRVHLAAIDHAVVGDTQYRGVRPALALHRPFLHAYGLAFTHPETGVRLAFRTPLPEDLAAMLGQLDIDLTLPELL